MSDLPTRLKFAITNYAAGAISYKGFASLVDIPYRTLQNYLSGERSPNTDALEKLANNGINIQWLITGDGTPYVISELERSLLDTVFLIHSREIILSAFGELKELYNQDERSRLLSFIMSNNYLHIGDIVRAVADDHTAYPELRDIESALGSGELDDLFDNPPTNIRELWKARQAIKEARSRGTIAAFRPDDSEEVGE